jgi:hypothetical protein
MPAAALFAALAWSAAPVAGQTQPAPPALQEDRPTLTGLVRNWTRLSHWDFFEPPPGGGDPTYQDLGNRLQVGLQLAHRRIDVLGVVQYVQLWGLPAGAFGPGPLGIGAVYRDHAGRSEIGQVYLRYLTFHLKNLGPGLELRAGRMGYTSGAEAASGSAKIEAVKRQRMDARLIGEFEWSMFQRGYDGVRIDSSRPGWHVSGAVLRPTQGGFEPAAGVRIGDIDLLAGTLTVRPGSLLPRTEWQVFAYRYHDDRAITARPDNTGRVAARVDVRVTSYGTSLVGAYPTAAGEIDLLIWAVGQTGAWYELDHRAYSVAAEVGHQWSQAPWRPWIRGGYLVASGDRDPADHRHGTFFQMLPTVRRFSLTATYSQMNLTDLFIQALLRPRPSLGLRGDIHRVGLAEAADRWYFGSGATQQSGRIFGLATRPSHGATDLGTVVEGAFDYRVTPHFSINGYLGSIRGGDVVRGAFRGRRLTFAYLENVVQF